MVRKFIITFLILGLIFQVSCASNSKIKHDLEEITGEAVLNQNLVRINNFETSIASGKLQVSGDIGIGASGFELDEIAYGMIVGVFLGGAQWLVMRLRSVAG